MARPSRIAAAATIAAGIVFATSSLAQERVFFGIATGGTGGTYYPLGGMLAQLISNKVVIGGKKLSATAETSGASVANAQLLGRKDIESAFVAADILDAAYNGKGQFDGKPLKNLRALGALYPEQVQLVTLASANVKSLRTSRASRCLRARRDRASGNCWATCSKSRHDAQGHRRGSLVVRSNRSTRSRTAISSLR